MIAYGGIDMIKSVRVYAYSGTYEATTIDDVVTLYTDSDVTEEVIAFIQNDNVHKESLSSAVSIYSA